MAAKIEINQDTILDVVGTAAAAYVAYALTGGSPIPGFAEIVPFIAAVAMGIFVWKHVRKNN